MNVSLLSMNTVYESVAKSGIGSLIAEMQGLAEVLPREVSDLDRRSCRTVIVQSLRQQAPLPGKWR